MSRNPDRGRAGQTYHKLYLANDNDFVPGVAGDNKFFVFRFSDADLAANVSFQNPMFAISEPANIALRLGGLVLVGAAARRSRRC
jgi:hypothetical protein